MQLSHLEKLSLIEQYGSINQAAKNLNMTQAALSKLITELESELNITFFARTTKGITLTDEGQEAFRLLEDITGHLDNIRISAGKRPFLTGYLPLSLPPSLYNTLAADLLHDFKNLYPAVKLYLTEKNTRDGLLAVAQKSCRLAVGLVIPERAPHYLALARDLHIAHTPLGSCRFKVLMSPQNPLATCETIRLADLADWIIFEYMAEQSPLLNERVSHSYRYKIYNRETLKKLIVLNRGIAIMPEMIEQRDYYFASGLLVSKILADCPLLPQYHLFYSQSITISPLDNDLILLLSQYIANLTNGLKEV